MSEQEEQAGSTKTNGTAPPKALPETALPPTLSDDDLAVRFSDKHGKTMRYVARWGKWFTFNGTVWEEDATIAVFDRARLVCRDAAPEAALIKLDERKIAAAGTIAAVVKLAGADRRHAATTDQWDADPWLLNTPTGAVDLRTGTIRENSPLDYCTKITMVGPGGDCPTWLRFLDEITLGDVQLQWFLQRIIGYSLTGSTREHALAFLYGTGGNGKSVLLSTISAIMKDYAKVAAMETFTASNTDRHPTDMAGLRGARLVTASETEEGRPWAEAKIKALTGGDTISARFMRQDFFEYVPQFTLLVAGNHKPALRSTDEGMRRRVHMVPFAARFPNPDRDLAGKLLAEAGGILAWAIAGAMEWQKIGLAPPEAVKTATDDYMAAEDTLAGFLDDGCIVNAPGEPIMKVRSTDLFAAWRSYAMRTGEDGGSQKKFSQGIAARGFKTEREGGTGKILFLGLGLKPAATGPDGDNARTAEEADRSPWPKWRRR